MARTGVAKHKDTHDISPGLLRQRRNLFVASLIALFAYFADATVTSVTAMGTQILFGRPNALPWFLLLSSDLLPDSLLPIPAP